MTKIPKITFFQEGFKENRSKQSDANQQNTQKCEVHDIVGQGKQIEKHRSPFNTSDSDEEYIRALEIVLDEYTRFTEIYKGVVKLAKNPFKFRKQARPVFLRLTKAGESFNRVISQFKAKANPPEDLKKLHEDLLQSLHEFEVFNIEFPKLAKEGNLFRITELSKGLDRGQKGIQSFFFALDVREKRKEQKENTDS